MNLVEGNVPTTLLKFSFPFMLSTLLQTLYSTTDTIIVGQFLESRGLSMASIIKTTVLLKDIADFGAMNAVYAEFFTGDYPARAAFQVAALPKDALVEIEAVAAE